MKKFFSNSVEETHKVSAEILKLVKLPSVLFLSGDLGAGKTEFVRGLAKNFLGSDSEVTSPTYSFLQCYKQLKAGSAQIYHLDFYRLKSVDDLESLGFWDLFDQKNAIIVVEWANLFDVSIPKSHQRLDLAIEVHSQSQRVFNLNSK